jgi:integrase/recombinase XerD
MGFSMKLDAPKRDMHDYPVLSVARQPGGVSRVLKLGHVDYSNRIVFFDDEAGYCLKHWLEVRESRKPMGSALWISTWGKKVDYGSLQHTIQKAALQCGLRDSTSPHLEDHFSAHCTRHFFTTHLMRAGMPREFIQELRGDVRREAIDIYYHVDMEELRRSYLAHIPQLGV